MQARRLSLPPFGHILQSYQKEAIQLEFPIYIFVGREAKQEAYLNKSHGVLSSYLPSGDDFQKYHWPVKKQKVVLFDTGSSSLLGLNKMCHQILRAGAKSVCRYSDLAPIAVFTQERLHGKS